MKVSHLPCPTPLGGVDQPNQWADRTACQSCHQKCAVSARCNWLTCKASKITFFLHLMINWEVLQKWTWERVGLVSVGQWWTAMSDQHILSCICMYTNQVQVYSMVLVYCRPLYACSSGAMSPACKMCCSTDTLDEQTHGMDTRPQPSSVNRRHCQTWRKHHGWGTLSWLVTWPAIPAASCGTWQLSWQGWPGCPWTVGCHQHTTLQHPQWHEGYLDSPTWFLGCVPNSCQVKTAQ